MSNPKPVTPISAEDLARLDEKYAARYKSDKPSHWREAVAEEWPSVRATIAQQAQRIAELEREVARMYSLYETGRER